MSKYHNVNLEALGSGVIVAPIFVEEKIINDLGISTKASHQKSERVWKGESEVVRVGPDVKGLKEGDRVYINMSTNHKIAFEHAGHSLLWTLEPVVFAKITAKSKIVM